jgi:diapolycopene oxygenase
LPHIFARTFEKAGKRIEDYVSMCPVRPHWRNFFEDGTIIDLVPDLDSMDKQAEKVGEAPESIRRFLAYSENLYDLIDRGYFRQGLDDLAAFRAYYGLSTFPKFDLLRSMHQSTERHFKTPYFVDIFDFFIKYVGSSAYRAPAFLNCLPTIQFRYDLWYVPGGMYGLAKGLEKLMRELGVCINLNAEVTQVIPSSNGRDVQGIRLADGTKVGAEIVVSNLEFIPTYQRLLGAGAAVSKQMQRRMEPACSGLIIDLGLDCKYEHLAHHNFFFSKDQKKHFHDVFQKRCLPDDPTLYVVAASRTDPSVAPRDCDCLKILPHIPYLDSERRIAHSDYEALRERVLDKIERMGCSELRRHVVFEHFWTPHDIEKMYYSNGGSIYGVVSDRFKNFAFKAPKTCPEYEGLFFVGGTVNPGGGMPMVFLCGQNVARTIVKWDAQRES